LDNHSWHNFSAILFLLFLVAKIGIHSRLNRIHQRPSGLNAMMLTPFAWLLPYSGETEPACRHLRLLCHGFWALACGALILNLIAGIGIL
jgi:hypothetical protein